MKQEGILEKMLKNKMIEDAHKFVIDTYNWQYYCRGINEALPGSYEASLRDRRDSALEAMQKAARELNFEFSLIFDEEMVTSIKWYHHDTWIRPINGCILPIKVQKNTKPKRNPIPTALRHEVFLRDAYRCRECGATNHQTRLEVDHIIPVSQGGTDELKNLQTLCAECNRAKSNRAWTAPPGKNLIIKG